MLNLIAQLESEITELTVNFSLLLFYVSHRSTLKEESGNDTNST